MKASSDNKTVYKILNRMNESMRKVDDNAAFKKVSKKWKIKKYVCLHLVKGEQSELR